MQDVGAAGVDKANRVREGQNLVMTLSLQYPLCLLIPPFSSLPGFLNLSFIGYLAAPWSLLTRCWQKHPSPSCNWNNQKVLHGDEAR